MGLPNFDLSTFKLFKIFVMETNDIKFCSKDGIPANQVLPNYICGASIGTKPVQPQILTGRKGYVRLVIFHTVLLPDCNLDVSDTSSSISWGNISHLFNLHHKDHNEYRLNNMK